MDLLSITRTITRHKLATLPIALLTVAAAVYVLAIKAPTFQTTADYILLSPPAAPTPAQISAQPKLGKVNADNPYLRYGDLAVVVDLLTQAMSTDGAKSALEAQGADKAYSVAPSPTFAPVAPILHVTGVGGSPASAMQTASLVGRAMNKELSKLQSAQGVSPHFFITMLQVGAPNHAQMQVTGKLRSVVGVAVIGLIVLFVVISTLEAAAQRKAVREEDAGALTLAPQVSEPAAARMPVRPLAPRPGAARPAQANGPARSEPPRPRREPAPAQATPVAPRPRVGQQSQGVRPGG
jgi:hypothetical protein